MAGSRSMEPEQDGQLKGDPFRSLAMRCSACAGLYAFGRGLRMSPPEMCPRGADVGCPEPNGFKTNLLSS
jgi:hypothetical protein